MYLNPRQTHQQGLGLISAIFVITILAMLVVGMSTFFKFGQQVTVQEILTQRAVWAANAGAELAFVCLTKNSGMSTGCDATGASVNKWPTSGTFAADGLKGCYAEVVHRELTASGGLNKLWIVTSTGYCGDTSRGIGSASRQTEVALTAN